MFWIELGFKAYRIADYKINIVEMRNKKHNHQSRGVHLGPDSLETQPTFEYDNPDLDIKPYRQEAQNQILWMKGNAQDVLGVLKEKLFTSTIIRDM